MPGWVVFAIVAVNLGLIYLLLAARLGRRTIVHAVRIDAPADRVWSALAPLGENAGWSGEVLSATPRCI